MRVTALTGLAVAGLVAGGCAAAPSTPTVTAEDLGLSAEAVYGRHSKVRGAADIRMTNSGGADVDVVSYQIRHPLFAVVDPELRDSTVAAGRTVMRPVPFGAPRCDVTDPADAEVRLGVRTAGGIVEVDVPLTDGEPGLVTAHATACAGAAVLGVASITLGPDWTRTGDTELRTTLTLDRQSPGTVTVAGAGGSILFSFLPDATDPVVSLGEGEVEASVGVTLTVARCDTHALIESKTSFTFPLTASVDGAEPVPLTVTAPDDGRTELQQLLARSCGLEL